MLAAKHFGLGQQDVIELAKSAARAAFERQDSERVLKLIDDFERRQQDGQ
jgi:hypothetical protein